MAACKKETSVSNISEDTTAKIRAAAVIDGEARGEIEIIKLINESMLKEKDTSGMEHIRYRTLQLDSVRMFSRHANYLVPGRNSQNYKQCDSIFMAISDSMYKNYTLERYIELQTAKLK